MKQIMKLPQNIFRVLAEGLERVEVMDLDVADGCLVADAAILFRRRSWPFR